MGGARARWSPDLEPPTTGIFASKPGFLRLHRRLAPPERAVRHVPVLLLHLDPVFALHRCGHDYYPRWVESLPEGPVWTSELLERRFQERLRKHPEFIAILLRALDLRPGQRLVDIGCGSGPYSRLFAAEVAPEGQVIGMDLDLKLLSAGRLHAAGGPKLSFAQADAFRLPLADSVADVAFCNTLLWLLPEPERALREMARVVRPGGSVCASEPDGGLFIRYDEDGEYLALAEKAHEAFIRGVSVLYGADFRIGRKLPALFQRCGLTELHAYPRFGVNLACDPRSGSVDDLIGTQAWRLRLLRAEDAPAVERRERGKRLRIAGGMSEREVEEYLRRQERRLEKRLADPDTLRADVSVATWGGLIVVGRKPVTGGESTSPDPASAQ